MLKLKPNPTFKAKVAIQVPGGAPASIEVEFKHMTRSALEHFLTSEEAKTRKDEDTVLEIACGWSGVDSEFNRDSLAALFESYHAAARSIVETYVVELTQARAKN